MDIIKVRILNLLKEKHMTKADVLKKSNLKKSTLYNIFDEKTDVKNINIETMKEICSALNTTLDYIINGNEELKYGSPNKQTENTIRLIARGGKVKEFKVSDEQRKAIETLLGKNCIDSDVDI